MTTRKSAAKKPLRLLTEAHNKIGLVIAGLLFVIFFTGAISLFRAELTNWQFLNKPVSESQLQLTTADVVNVVRDYAELTPGKPLTVRSPGLFNQYYVADIHTEQSPQQRTLIIHPYSGDVLSTSDKQGYGDFVFRLHHDLLLPGGKYLVGLIGLLALFLLVSGLIIHWEKLKDQFFRFRPDKTKDKWLDLHKLVGVASLPFSVLLTFTGVVFNLILVYQAAFLFIVYKGDQAALVNDAGYYHEARLQETQQRKTSEQRLNELQIKAALQSDLSPMFMRVNNMDDSRTSVRYQLFGSGFDSSQNVVYGVESGQLLYKNNPENPNVFAYGMEVLKHLHVADYADYSLKWLYFALTAFGSVMMAGGSLLWLNKQEKRTNLSPTGLKLARSSMFMLMPAAVCALSVGVLLAQLSAAGLTALSMAQTASFLLMMITGGLLSFVMTNQRLLVASSLFIAGFALLTAAFIAIVDANPWHGVTSAIGLLGSCFVLAGWKCWPVSDSSTADSMGTVVEKG